MFSSFVNTEISTKWNSPLLFVVAIPLTFTYFALISLNLIVVPAYPGLAPRCFPTETQVSWSSLTKTS